jgi:hypothetical protein
METLIMSVVGIAVVIGAIFFVRELIVAVKAKPSEVYQEPSVQISEVEKVLNNIPWVPPHSPSVTGVGALFHRLIEALAHVNHHV